MTSFKDGPALDQITDELAVSETLFAYEIVGVPSMCHINRSGGRGGFYVMADYQFVTDQPTDAQMRDQSQWRHWCEEQAKRS